MVLLSPVMRLTNLSSPSGDKLMMHSEKVKGNSMRFASSTAYLYSLSVTGH